MMVVEGWVVEDGLRVVVRSVCTGQCHLGNTCEGGKISFLVGLDRVEKLGFELSVIEAVETAFQEYPRLVELIDH
jgi:hypothetical protein